MGNSISLANKKKYLFLLNEILFVGPIFIIFIIIKIIPLFFSVTYSLTDWNGISSKAIFSGLDNYARLISDHQYWESLSFTLRFAVLTVFIANILGFSLAYFLSKPVLGRNVMRAAFYIPNTLGGLVLGFIWKFIFLSGFAYIFKETGFKIFSGWLGTSTTSFWAMIWVQAWVLSGFLMLLYISGLSVIPNENIESALIDGANGLRIIRHIILPLLMPTITRCLFISFLNCMRVYDLNLGLTDGNPFRSSETVTYNMYVTAFSDNKMGYGCAKALIFIIIVVAISNIQAQLTSKKEVDL